MSFLTEDIRQLTVEDLKRMLLGRKYYEAALDRIPDTAAYKDVIRRYLQKIVKVVNEGVGILFAGEPRSGKTCAAVIIGKAVVAHGGTALFIRADDLVMGIQNREDFDASQSLRERALGVDVLILDDLGVEKTFIDKKQNHARQIENIIRNRVDSKKAVLLTSSLTTKQIDELYGLGFTKVLQGVVWPVHVCGVNWSEQEVARAKELIFGDTE